MATTKHTAKKATAKKKSVTTKKAAPKKKVAPKAATPRKATAKKAAPKQPVVRKAAPKKKAVKKASVKKAVARKTEGGGFTPYQLKKGEDYMNDDQLAHFRELLMQWKRELMEEVDRTVEHMKSEAANFADPADRATQEEEFSLELRTRDRERKLIKKIDESIALIDSEDFGYCEACGIEIGIRRLEARPTATLCIDCKTLQEIKEKQLSA